MRLLFICAPILPVPDYNGGAVENLVTQLLNYNEKLQNKITIATVFCKEIDYTKFNNVNFVFISNKIMYLSKFFPLRYILRLYAKKIIKKINVYEFDEIIIENEFVMGEELYKKYKIKSLLHLHNEYINNKTFNTLKYFKGVICISDYIEKTVKIYDDSIPTYVVNNGIDFSKLFSQETIKYDKYTYVFAGRISPEKGILELVEAFDIAFKNDDTVQLLIMGGKSYRKSMYFSRVIKKIKKNKNIIYLGYVNKLKMAAIYAKSNVGVIPSLWNEPFGLALVEQMYMKLPIICSGFGAFPSILGSDYPYFINPNNIDEFANILKHVKNNSEENLEIGYKNYNRSLDFSSEKYCYNFFKLIEDFNRKIN